MADESMQDVDVYAESEWKARFIDFTVEDGVARITLNRPPANVLSIDVNPLILSGSDPVVVDALVELEGDPS